MVWDPLGCVVKIREYPQYSGSEVDKPARKYDFHLVSDWQQPEKYLV